MAITDNSIDSLLIDSGLVIGINTPAIPPMHPPIRRMEMATRASAQRQDIARAEQVTRGAARRVDE